VIKSSPKHIDSVGPPSPLKTHRTAKMKISDSRQNSVVPTTQRSIIEKQTKTPHIM